MFTNVKSRLALAAVVAAAAAALPAAEAGAAPVGPTKPAPILGTTYGGSGQTSVVDSEGWDEVPLGVVDSEGWDEVPLGVRALRR
jgi:hypothetical protein